MLLLWTTGVVFLFKTLKAMAASESRLPLLLTIIFILSPAWAMWSMKARSGYLTSFTCSFIVTWMLFRKDAEHRPRTFFIMGLLLAVIYESQPLWLAGLLPYVAFKLWTEHRLQNTVYLCAGSILLLLPFMFLQHISPYYWQPGVFAFNADTIYSNLRAFPQSLFIHLHGYFYLTNIFDPSFFSAAFSGLFIACMVLICIAGLYFIFTGRSRAHLLFLLSLLPVLFTLAYSLLLKRYAPRYLLPLSGWVCISALLFIQRVRLPGPVLLVVPALLLSGIGAIIGFKDFNFQSTTKAGLVTALNYLHQQDVHNVFASDGLLQWQIMFYSGEKIIARYHRSGDRCPDYVHRVNAALANNEKTAIMASGNIPKLPPETPVIHVDGYSLILRPGRELLGKLGFEF